MRQILFRGKRIDNGEWIYGGISVFDGIFEMFDSDSVDNSCYEVEPETIGQYIGHCDSNGKRIFEGDAIENPKGKRLFIKYVNCGFFAVHDNGQTIQYNTLNSGYLKNKVVVDNIHDVW